MDPPYQKNMIEPTLRNLHLSQSLVTGTRVIVEHSHREPVLTGPLPFEIADIRKYGKSLVTILEYVV
jgi:16S rRNA G966 N2-methylase RsmD